jgi:hypothetical protein
MDFDYKNYALQRLEEWLHDCMSSGEATPQEIYDTIKNVVQEQYEYYKNGAEKTNELLSLLNVHKDQIQFNFDTGYQYNVCDADNTSDYCSTSWNSFWENDVIKEDKVAKWVLPVQQKIEDGVDEYYVEFPDDLLEAANLKEGDKVEWVDNGDGSYTLIKLDKEKWTDPYKNEMIAAGYTMIDGVWTMQK